MLRYLLMCPFSMAEQDLELVLLPTLSPSREGRLFGDEDDTATSTVADASSDVKTDRIRLDTIIGRDGRDKTREDRELLDGPKIMGVLQQNVEQFMKMWIGVLKESLLRSDDERQGRLQLVDVEFAGIDSGSLRVEPNQDVSQSELENTKATDDTDSASNKTSVHRSGAETCETWNWNEEITVLTAEEVVEEDEVRKKSSLFPRDRSPEDVDDSWRHLWPE